MSRSNLWSLALLISVTGAFSSDAFCDAKVVRLSIVNTPEPSGLLGDLIPIFENESGLKVVISSSSEPYDEANKCNADLIVSHYGHKGVENFIESGGGKFPRPVFANQAALIGPTSDPAGIAGIADAVEAIKKIAASGAPFVVNHSPAERYLGDTLIAAAGVSPKLINVPDLKSQEAVAQS